MGMKRARLNRYIMNIQDETIPITKELYAKPESHVLEIDLEGIIAYSPTLRVNDMPEEELTQVQNNRKITDIA